MALDTETELIAASLLPEETVERLADSSASCNIKIVNEESRRSLHICVSDAYPSRDAVKIELKGESIGRDEAFKRAAEVDQLMDNWDQEDEFPLYQLLTSHMLQLIAPDSPSGPSISAVQSVEHPVEQTLPVPYHLLLTSHHLLSTTKRKDFLALASQLSLTGFSKVGHPGIYYAIGEKEDLEEWLREVKGWNWLALRVRVGIEQAPGEDELGGRGKEQGARGGKGRGDWIELEKISEALEWMRQRGRQGMLMDLGIGGASTD